MKNCVIVSAVRTAIGSFNGSLASTSAIDLGATVIKAAIERAKIDSLHIDEVIMGNVLQAGLGQNPARQALLKSGLAETVCGFTVNKVCGSGLKSVALAAVAIQKQDLLETMPGQRAHPIANRGDKSGRAQGNGAGKAQVMLGHADVEGGADQQVGVLLRLMGDDFRAHPVGAQQAGGAVLFIGTDGNHHRAAAFKELADLDPGGVV